MKVSTLTVNGVTYTITRLAERIEHTEFGPCVFVPTRVDDGTRVADFYDGAALTDEDWACPDTFDDVDGMPTGINPDIQLLFQDWNRSHELSDEYRDNSGDSWIVVWTAGYADVPRAVEFLNTVTGERFTGYASDVFARVDSGEWRTPPEPECINGPDNCRGKVEYRSVDGYRAFPRCERHFDEVLAATERAYEYQSDCALEWFDESYAGERWDDDY